MTAADTLFVFIDESSNLDFSERGTKCFVMSAVSTREPLISALAMQDLKYNLMRSGADQFLFHATDNSRWLRSRVIERISSLTNLQVHSVRVDKRTTRQELQDIAVFYAHISKTLVRQVLVDAGQHSSDVVVIFDSALTARHQKAFLKVVKPALAHQGQPYRILFHPVKNELNGQIADYFAWAIFRAYESDDATAFDALVLDGHHFVDGDVAAS